MKRPVYFTIVSIVLLSLFEFVPTRSVQAGNEQVVMNVNDGGVGSLRQAIVAASNGDIITFAPSLSGQTINLVSEIAVDKSITIDGSSLVAPVTISGDTDNDGDGDVQLISIALNTSATIKNINFTMGFTTSQLKSGGINNLGSLTINESSFIENIGSQGGAIRNSGNLTVNHVDFTTNSAPEGGAILNDLNATAIITSSIFTQNSTTYGNGGAIENIGNLTVNDSLFTQNTAGDGGAISNQGTLTTANSTFSNNSADFGGGIVNFGILTATKSNLSLNSGSMGGGGIMNFHTGILTVEDSTISNNSAGNGGGIFNFNTATITNSTISENSVSTNGGGISTWFSLTLTNSTVVGNHAETGGGVFNLGTLTTTNVTFSENAATTGGGVYNSFVTPEMAGTFNYSNTIIANSMSGADCYNDGAITTNTNNLVENNAASPNQCGIPFISEGPKLGPLANNGGSTQSMALLSGSPAIDAGNDIACADTPVNNESQNGVTRPQGSHCDIGAFEHSSVIIVTNTNDNGPGSLRQAISDATNADTVTFDSSLAGQTIQLQSMLVIDKSITIDASALSENIVLSGDSDNDSDGDILILSILTNGNVSIKNVEFTKGYTSNSLNAGAISNLGNLSIYDSKFILNQGTQGGAIRNSGILLVENCAFLNNTASNDNEGGAILNNLGATVTIKNSSFIENSGAGGAIGNLGTLTIENSIFSNNSSALGGGALVNAFAGVTKIYKSTFTGNSTQENGGAINNLEGVVEIYQSTFSNNSAKQGGAIIAGILPYANNTTTLISDSVISNNQASLGGGGIEFDSGTSMTIDKTTISGNTAAAAGGIANISGNLLTITNSTISNNTATQASGPGGIMSLNSPVTIKNSTITGNNFTAVYIQGNATVSNTTIADNPGGGLEASNYSLSITNTIIANNDFDCRLLNGATLSVNQNNLIEISNGCGTPASTADPLLGPLTNNGGTTETMALLPGSPAIEMGNNATCETTDQRGIVRPQGNSCDIGSFELEYLPVTITSTFISTATQDGQILETTETSGKGGSIDSTATRINLGDDAANKQYRAILSFDTSSIPDNAVITSVTLKFKYAGKVGTLPFSTHGNLMADIRKGSFSNNATLQANDFKAGASKNNVLAFTNSMVSNWFSQSLAPANFQYVNLTNVTQFRLRFQTDDNHDFGADLLKIFSSNAGASGRPKLIIEYYIP